MANIRDMEAGEIPILKDFAPPEWNTDLSLIFRRHFGQPYFHPIVAELDGRLVGCANGLVQGTVGWLGNIIVRPDCRGRGIGSALTEELVRIFRSRGIEHQVLIATNMGEPVYRRLGFEVTSYYSFFSKQEEPMPAQQVLGTRPLVAEDAEALFALDQSVTGEGRGPFLRRYLQRGRVHVDASGKLDGFYLPELGAGLLIASNDEAGLALLRYRLGEGGRAPVVPEQNRLAADFMLANGFVESSRVPRMALGHDVRWQPEHVYCRGSGFCG